MKHCCTSRSTWLVSRYQGKQSSQEEKRAGNQIFVFVFIAIAIAEKRRKASCVDFLIVEIQIRLSQFGYLFLHSSFNQPAIGCQYRRVAARRGWSRLWLFAIRPLEYDGIALKRGGTFYRVGVDWKEFQRPFSFETLAPFSTLVSSLDFSRWFGCRLDETG